MVEEETTQVIEERPKGEATLMAEMNSAVTSGDYKAVAKVAQELVKFQKAKEQIELEAKQAILAEKTVKVKEILDKAVGKLIDSGELDKADGIWYTQDFGEKSTSCRLMKTAAKAKGTGGGGGAGKKFAISTTDLLEKYGTQEYKDGTTYQSAWDANTDKNWRYAIRESLLKKDGLIS